ncbi:gamma-aminobutyraldehyde dehydrogenase [Streptomyces vinaceus]|nr:gamma-aminobutyraldehyde dehydrogenase [Streptomyces vinaceus]
MADALTDAVSGALLNHIGGVDRPAASGETMELTDPATGRVHARAPHSGRADTEAAVAAAAAAYGGWSTTTPAVRQRALLSLADAMEAHADALTAAETADTGKPVRQFRDEELPTIVDTVRYFAGAARNLPGAAAAEYTPGRTSLLRREPVGVCAQITPWNYPLMMAAWKIAPAVAAGNTTVLKPADTTPSSSVFLARIASAHLPPGVVNVVCGDRDTGRALTAHRDVALIAVTGSVRAGQEIAAAAAAGLERVHLELGGNAPVIVHDDVDVRAAAAALAAVAYYNAGQDCTAPTRLLVHHRVHDAFLAAFAASARQLRTGPPGDEETFGPVVTVQPFADEAEALCLANDVRFGLAAGVWTSDHDRAMRTTRMLHTGIVWVNTHGTTVSEMPHGGVEHSGYGSDLSLSGLLDYTQVKHVML